MKFIPSGFLLFCTGILIFLSGGAVAQRYPFYNLRVEDGLAQSQPTAILEDRQGYLWVGTLGGLSRYGGKSFRNFTARDGLPGNMVRSLALDSAGNVWIGGLDGLCKYDGKRFRTVPIPVEGTEKINVRQVAVDEAGVLWVLAGGRLYFLKDDMVQPLRVPFANTRVTAFLSHGSRLWLTTADGRAFTYYNKQWESLSLPQHKGGAALINKIYADRRGRIWLVGNQLLRFQKQVGISPVFADIDSSYFPLHAITEDLQGNIWLGCTKGVIRLQPNGLSTHFGRQNGLSDNIFSALFTDRAGNVWMASDGQGLFRFSGAPFTIVDETTGLGSGQVMSLAEGNDTSIYLGTYDAGLYQYRRGMATKVKLPVMEMPSITALNFHDNILWLGTRSGGLWRWDGSRLQVFKRTNSALPSDYIITLSRDSMQRLWIGTAKGAALLDSENIRPIAGIRSDVQAVLSWTKDSMILTGSLGMWWYWNGKVSPFKSGTILDELPPQTLARTGSWLWAGTSENGIVVYDLSSGNSVVLNTENVLLSDFIYSVLVDDAERVWIGTGLGVHRISDYRTGSPQIAIYGSGQNVAGMESNHNAALQAADGSVWLGTTAGAMLFPTIAPPQLAQNTAVVLQSVALPGIQGIPQGYYDSVSAWNAVPQNLLLPYRENTVSFTFQSMALVQQKQVRYRHRLVGLDTAWSPWVAENTITYSALPPGHYRLEVESFIQGNRAGSSSLSYPFTIKTPFHKSFLFRALLVAFLILIGIGIQFLLSQRRRRLLEMIQRMRAEEQAKVRHRTAEDFHDEVGNRITRINVLANVLRGKLSPLPADADRMLRQIQDNGSELYNGIRDIVWALKPANDNLFDLVNRIASNAAESFEDTDTCFHFDCADEAWRDVKLPLDVNRSLMMIFKEAVSNCLKYAHAKNATFSAVVGKDDQLTLMLADDGNGFDRKACAEGNGLQHMRQRTARIGALLEIRGGPDQGTSIAVLLNLPTSRIHSTEDAASRKSYYVSLLRSVFRRK